MPDLHKLKRDIAGITFDSWKTLRSMFREKAMLNLVDERRLAAFQIFICERSLMTFVLHRLDKGQDFLDDCGGEALEIIAGSATAHPFKLFSWAKRRNKWYEDAESIYSQCRQEWMTLTTDDNLGSVNLEKLIHCAHIVADPMKPLDEGNESYIALSLQLVEIGYTKALADLVVKHFGEQDSLTREMMIADKVKDILVPQLLNHASMYGLIFDAIPVDSKIQPLIGFLGGAADVFSQSRGGSAGGHGSINGTLRIYQGIFSSEKVDLLLRMTFALHDNSPPDFEAYMRLGADFGNAIVQNDMDAATRASSKLILQNYRAYCHQRFSEE